MELLKISEIQLVSGGIEILPLIAGPLIGAALRVGVPSFYDGCLVQPLGPYLIEGAIMGVLASAIVMAIDNPIDRHFA